MLGYSTGIPGGICQIRERTQIPFAGAGSQMEPVTALPPCGPAESSGERGGLLPLLRSGSPAGPQGPLEGTGWGVTLPRAGRAGGEVTTQRGRAGGCALRSFPWSAWIWERFHLPKLHSRGCAQGVPDEKSEKPSGQSWDLALNLVGLCGSVRNGAGDSELR